MSERVSLTRNKQHMRPLIASSLLVVCALTPATAQTPTLDASFPLRVRAISTHGADAAFGGILAGAVGPDGALYIVDHVNTELVALSPDGSIAWKRGGSGRGPGEFGLPYRVSVDKHNVVHVFDRASSEISRFTHEGEFIDRQRVPFMFSQVDAIVTLDDGGYAISGVTAFGDEASDAGIHVFDAALAHVRSFGPLPNATNRMVLNYWGAGVVTPYVDGTILYSRRIPYELYVYDVLGALHRTIYAPFELEGTPDDAIVVEEAAGRLEVAMGQPVDVPLSPVSMGDGLVLAGRRLTDDRRMWDLFDAAGDLVASTSIPAEWKTVLGADVARHIIWVRGEHQLEPVVFRIEVESLRNVNE